MLRPNLKVGIALFVLIEGIFFAPVGSLFPTNSMLAAETRSGRDITLNGLRFSIPKGYVSTPGNELDSSVFLFYKKYNEGSFISVPSAPFDEVELVNRNTEIALKKFFPKGTQAYEWKELNDRRKVSKFETGASKTMGFNDKSLIIVQVHHFLVAEKHLFIGDLFRWTHGDNKEIFAKGLGGESMQGCNDLVEIVYSITGEKLNETNSPCELIALPPGN